MKYLMLVPIALVLAACCCPLPISPPPGPAVPKPAAEKPAAERPAEKPAERVTRANYDRVKLGATIKEVEAVLGFGRELSRNDTVIMAKWTSGGFPPTVIVVTFVDNRVHTKAIR